MGQGNLVGDMIFMEWQDPTPHVSQVVSVMSGWGGNGDWNVCHQGWDADWTPPEPIPVDICGVVDGDGSSCVCIEVYSPDTTSYDVNEYFLQPLSLDDQTVTFTVQMANDAHMRFWANENHSGESYEIVLSG